MMSSIATVGGRGGGGERGEGRGERGEGSHV